MAQSIDRRRLLQWGSLWIGGVWLTACDRRTASLDESLKNLPRFQLSSPAFAADAFIPKEFTCDGADRSPALNWAAPPAATQSLTLVVEDPDAPNGSFIHWVLYDLTAQLRALPAAVPTQPFLTSGGVQGKNDFGEYGYRGPCPPNGTHRYWFRLYAVDKLLDLPPGVAIQEVRAALKDHVLAVAELMGRYSRQP